MVSVQTSVKAATRIDTQEEDGEKGEHYQNSKGQESKRQVLLHKDQRVVTITNTEHDCLTPGSPRSGNLAGLAIFIYKEQNKYGLKPL